MFYVAFFIPTFVVAHCQYEWMNHPQDVPGIQEIVDMVLRVYTDMPLWVLNIPLDKNPQRLTRELEATNKRYTSWHA